MRETAKKLVVLMMDLDPNLDHQLSDQYKYEDFVDQIANLLRTFRKELRDG